MPDLALRPWRRRDVIAAAAVAALFCVAGWLRPLHRAAQRTQWQAIDEPLGRWNARFPGPVEGTPAKHPRTGLSGMDVKARVNGASYEIVALPVLFDNEPLPQAAGAVEAQLQSAGWAAQTSIRTTFAGEEAYRIEARKGDLSAVHILVEHRDMRLQISASGEHAAAFLASFRWTGAGEQEGDRTLARSSP
jgi:hypothetical protein